MDSAQLDTSFMLSGAPQRHAEYTRLRETAAIHPISLRSGKTGWLVTGYDEVRQALADPRLLSRTAAIADRRSLPEDLLLGMNTHMLNLDPPDHTRLRRLVSAAFTRRRMEQMRPRVSELAEDLLDRMADQEEVDLIESLASRLPVRVLTDMLGIPEEQFDTFHRWSMILTATAPPLDQLDVAATEMLHYVRLLLDVKRRAPQADLLSALVSVREGEDRLTDHELTSMVFLLLIAGQETTASFIGNAAYSLLTHPDQMHRLRTDTGLTPAAVEEFLRYESPAQAALRVATAPLELAGVPIPVGSVVILSLLGANRDDTRFRDAAQLTLDREHNPHLAFGHGIHYCLGAPLARMEGAIAIASLLKRFPDLRLAVPAESLSWRLSMFMHGLTALPVRLR